MCTAIISIEPGLPVLLAGIRDELADRPWVPPARHWPQFPGLTGGKDLQADGTWLAVAQPDRRASCVLNGRGRMAEPRSRRSRGILPLRAAAGLGLDRDELRYLDPFHLIVAEPATAALVSWDGERLTERTLPPGLHIVVNSGLGGDLLAQDGRPAGEEAAAVPAWEAEASAIELARVRYFGPLFRAARQPAARAGDPLSQAWGDWLPLLNGAHLPVDDPRALIVRRELPDGRIWGTSSISVVALAPDQVRYDFTATPGDPAGWYPVPAACSGSAPGI